MSTQEQEERTEQAMETAESTTTDPAVLAAVGSVALSWYFFFVSGNKERGLFVGLWPPTILAFASYFQQTEMRDHLDRTMGQSQSGMRGTVERIIGNQ